MALLDMFDKLDDIIYKPVEAICEWTKEPLRKWEHKRQFDSEAQRIAATEHENAEARAHEIFMAQQAADIEEARKRLDQELTEQERASVTADIEARARIAAEERRWFADIDQMIAEQEDARRDRLVESIKRYQIDLANAARDIVNSIGLMSLELREKANEMVLEKTKEYRALQDESKKQSLIELQEVKEMFFESDPDTYKLMVSNIMEERRSAVELAGRFIVELSEDIKRLNANTDELMKIGMENANKYLAPMANALGVTQINTTAPEQKKLNG